MLTCEAITSAPRVYSCHPQEYCLDILTPPRNVPARTAEQVARYYATRREKAAAKALAAGRVPGRIGAPPRLTAEEREASRVKQNRRRTLTTLAKRKARRAARAVAEGRTPGLVGTRSRFTEEERAQQRRERVARHKAKNREAIRARDAALHRERYAARKAGLLPPQVPGRVGRIRVLTDEQKRMVNRVCASLRRTRLRGNGGRFTRADIETLLAQQNGQCGYCARPLETEFHVDHWVPVVLGGSSDPGNLRLLHEKCNLLKGAKHPADLGPNDGYVAAATAG